MKTHRVSVVFALAAGLLVLSVLVGRTLGQSDNSPTTPNRGEPETRAGEDPRQIALAELPVEDLLRSLTFEDFSRREAVVNELGKRDWQAPAELVRIASEESTTMHLRGRYVLRRSFWALAPKVAAQLKADDAAERAKAGELFQTLVDRYPLDAHHHGGLQKSAIVLEKLGHHDLALDAYQRWVPPSSFCGTCDASIKAEKTDGIVRCLRNLKQFDKATELCWSTLRNDQGWGESVQLGMNLVEIYDAQNRLDQLSEELAKLPGGGERLLERVKIRQDFRAGEYESLLPHLTGGQVSHFPWDFASDQQRYWKQHLVARLFGQLGKKAVPLLAGHLSQLESYNAAWTIYALKLTGSGDAVAPVLEWLENVDEGLLQRESGLIPEMLAQFPEESTKGLVPLLKHQTHAHGALMQLGRMGTKSAVEALIAHFNGEDYATGDGEDSEDQQTLVQMAFAEHCAGALWRLTGETLGMEAWTDDRILSDGRQRWQQWWMARPRGFQVKTEAWWRSPEAAPLLVKALESRSRYVTWPALQDLLAVEHPVLGRYIANAKQDADPRVDYAQKYVAKMWLPYDPQAAIPALFPFASQGSEIQYALQLLIVPSGRDQRNDVTIQAFWKCKTPEDWRAWWSQYKDQLRLEPQERWW
jgi:HEAT repeat protein